jgi:hypothetical protein
VELIIEMRVRGSDVELVLAPGMVVDANDLVGTMKHGLISTQWVPPRR